MTDPDSTDLAGGPSRRTVLGGMAFGLAAAGLTGGDEAAASAAPAIPQTMDHPEPPFRAQAQPWPGLASQMVPAPDHGETSYKGSGRLAGRRALITGGDSGIGRAVAIAFAREGADVALGYLPAEQSDADQVAGYIRAARRKAVQLPGDIRDAGFCRQLVAAAVAGLGGLDILVNNAARQVGRASLLDIQDADFDDTFRTNIYANFWITRAAVPHLGRGSAIINTTAALDPEVEAIDYIASKGAVTAWTKGLARQLAGQGIRVNAVAPGAVWTPLQVTGGQTAEGLAGLGTRAPLGRPAQPVELAPLYVALADPMLGATTGEVFGGTSV